MLDAPFIISPAGYIFTTTFGSPVNGQGSQRLGFVAPIVPGGGNTVASGLGEFTTTATGRRGTMDLSVITGAPGANRAVAFLVDHSSPTKWIGIGLDTNNVPFALISTDGAATVLAESGAPGGPVTAGTLLNVRLVWDSTAPVRGTSYVALAINGPLAKFIVEPGAAWTSFLPGALLLGVGGYGGLSDFNGGAPFVQLSEQTASITTSIEAATRDPEAAALSATAALTGHLIASWKVSAALSSPTAALTGTMHWTRAGSAAISSPTATLTASLTLIPAPLDHADTQSLEGCGLEVPR